MPGICKTIKMRGFRFPETLACFQSQWVFWAIQNYPKNLCSFYVKRISNGEMTAKRTWVHAHVHMCVIHIYKRVLYKYYTKNGTLNFFPLLKFSLRLRKNNYAVWLKEIWRFSCLMVKCLVFQSIKIKIVLLSESHEYGFYNYKYIETLHKHGIYLTFSFRCLFHRTCHTCQYSWIFHGNNVSRTTQNQNWKCKYVSLLRKDFNSSSKGLYSRIWASFCKAPYKIFR